MINLTNELVFLTNGPELRKGILQAIFTTRKILLDAFYGGRHIDVDDITSSSTRVPSTLNLAFCKYFSGEDIFKENINVSEEEFLSHCNGLLDDFRKNRNLTSEDFSNIIPNFHNNGKKISAVFMYQIKRGIQIMLFALWRSGHILLTTSYIMPTTKESANGNVINLCKSLYSEVIDFFQGFRQNVVQGTPVIQASPGLTASVQNTIQSYAWRLIVATDWHTVDKVNLLDCVTILDHLQEEERQGRTRIPYPVIHMVQMLITREPEKMTFNVADISLARKRAASPLGNDRTVRTYTPDSITRNNICDSHTGTNIAENYPQWIKPQELYIKQCKKRGRKSIRNVETALALFNEYLFSEIPKHKKAAGHSDLSPPSPAEFDRKYLEDEDDIPSLNGHISKNRDSNTVYAYLREIDSFFAYFETVDRKKIDGSNFTNPIIREIDFPLIHRSKGSNKEIISQTYLPFLLSYLYSLESLFSYVYQELLDNNENVTKIFRQYSVKANTQINTEDLGYCPIVLFRKGYIPIKTIPIDVFQASECTINHLIFFRMPAWSHLIQLIICLETGIRTKHIEWLDIRKYDKDISRGKPLDELVKLFVSTDKVRRKPWSALVSRRVIELLDKQRKILNNLNYYWSGNEIWYDEHEGSVFGKIVPAFPSPTTNSHGLPHRDGYVTFFKRMFFSFQEFANENNLFSKKIAWVTFSPNAKVKYKSIITPHSCRATVISHAIHYLPPEIIGDMISGHTTGETVSYYARPDPHFMDELEQFQAIRIKGMASLSVIANSSSVYADEINSALHRAITKNRDGAFSDFGATCFEKETNGEVESGFTAIKDASNDQLAYQTTHICALNNNCSDDVVKEIGKYQCGGCWFALKTVDHIPRIDSHIRSLYAEIQEDQAHIDDMLTGNASKSVIEISEVKVAKKSANLAGWIVSLNILEDMRKDIATRNKFLVGKPDVIKQHIQKISTPSHPMTNLLLRVQDAVAYPEYFTPELKASMTKFRNLLLARTGKFDLIFQQPNGYAQLDEFRGIIRSVLETTDISIEDLQSLMTSELPMPANRIPLLEVS